MAGLSHSLKTAVESCEGLGWFGATSMLHLFSPLEGEMSGRTEEGAPTHESVIAFQPTAPAIDLITITADAAPGST